MGATERFLVSSLLIVVALFAPGFLVHAAPRFPGSLAGGLLGIAAATCMLLLPAYSLAKRIAWLRRHVSLAAILSFHVYAGAAGAVLGIVHTGHKYQSPLGIALVVAMLTVVFSGFAGRYYLVRTGGDIRDQRQELGALRTRYDMIASNAAYLSRVDTDPVVAAAAHGDRVPTLVAAIADLEQAIGRREILKRAFSRWVVLHIAVSLVMYLLLALHVWSGIYYGLRWLP